MRIIRYGTIRRGKVKFELGSKQDKFLHARNFEHSHVTETNGKKSIERFPKDVQVKKSGRARGYMKQL